jgi:hypothetical protein
MSITVEVELAAGASFASIDAKLDTGSKFCVVVGRIGFLDHLQIGLVDYEQLLYLGPYETL